ncbi:M56 family metallopeptidase [Carboxylicivirga taeanensis]|uniref:M56 family metallopeptidase n=1 Tax=Carboxylicivirga taeanensis TaxID=1416875 RepID=UPI003F6E3230
MDTFLELQLKSGGIIAISVVIYLLFMARDSFFVRNRVWLLITLFVPWLLPLLAMPVWLKALLFRPDAVAEPIVLTLDVPATEGVAIPDVPSLSWMHWLLGLYVVVSLVLLLRLVWGYYSINRLKRKARIASYKGYQLVLMDDETVNPFSFFKTIFMPAHLERNKYGQMILEHERTHCAQLHSIDISLAEWLLIVQWWNPFVWWLRKLIAQNHEYCVDNAMVQQTNEPQAYQYSLLNLLKSDRRLQLVNNFNQSLTKKRIVMMNKKNTSLIVGWIKNLLLVPLLGMALLAFTNPDKTAVNAFNSTEIGDTQDLRNAIAKSIKYPLEARDEGIEATVTANFDVDKKGKVINVRIGSDPDAVQLDKVVVMAYAGEAGQEKQGSSALEAAKNALEKEVVRVVEKLPVIEDKALVGKTLQMDFEFKLQKSASEMGRSLANGWEGRTTKVVNSKGEEFSLVVADGRIHLKGPKNNQPALVLDGKEVTVSELTTLNISEVKAIGHSPAGNPLKFLSTTPENGAFIIHTEAFLLDKLKNGRAFAPEKPSLVMVDGQEYSGEINDISPDDILNMNVLKGDAAAKKYGEKAKGGVIEITTKGNADAVQLFKSSDKVQISAMNVKVTADNGETPLFVVDGKKQERSEVDEQDIEFVSVLKGQEAIEQYGEDGKNGVVIINTKKGEVTHGNATLVAETIEISSNKADAVSFEGDAEHRPYVLYDGEVYEGEIKALDASKIESINVLKGDAATQKFGDKGKNGVIIIQSKK